MECRTPRVNRKVNCGLGLLRCLKVGLSIITNAALWWEIGEGYIHWRTRRYIKISAPPLNFNGNLDCSKK